MADMTPSSPPGELATLTIQELEAASLARFDFGPGYPQLVLPDWLAKIYADASIAAHSLEVPPQWSPSKQAELDRRLESAVRQFLAVPDAVTEPIRVTFSGSIALDRSISAISRLVHRRRPDTTHFTVVTTTPSIDIMRLFLQERREIITSFVSSERNGVPGELDVDQFIARLVELHSAGEAVVALVTSPENPTGAVWSEEELLKIARTCRDIDAIMLVDHAFVLSGVQEVDEVPRVWSLPSQCCDWIAVWDTGKTFGLNEDKLGFILSSGPEVSRAIDDAVSLVQFGVARRQKLLFAEVLSEANRRSYVGDLRAVCRRNLALAVDVGAPIARLPRAGSLLLLKVGNVGKTDEVVRRESLLAGVGVIAGNVFFHTDWRPISVVRLALSRDPEYFAEGLAKLLPLLE